MVILVYIVRGRHDASTDRKDSEQICLHGWVQQIETSTAAASCGRLGQTYNSYQGSCINVGVGGLWVGLGRAREIGRAVPRNGGPGSNVPAVPVRGVLELLERDEDEHGRRLESRPGREPALEHEHRALVAHRRADHLQRRPALRAGRGHDPALQSDKRGATRGEERGGGAVGERGAGRRR